MNNNGNKYFNSSFFTTKKIISVIVFLLVVALIIWFIWTAWENYSKNQENEPWLIQGTRVARTGKIIPGNVIKLSEDSKYGIEFTYSFWIFVNDWTYRSGAFKHVFHKGSEGANPILQAPGVWLYPEENKMNINMNTFASLKESCDIGNLPIGKWFNITIVVMGRSMDVFLNGKLKKRCEFDGIPKQNFGNLFITEQNGFDGFLSNFRYFNYAIPLYKIEQIMSLGPSKAPCTETGVAPPYFAEDVWFQTGFPNAKTL